MHSRKRNYGDLHWFYLSFMLLEPGLRFTKLSLDLTGLLLSISYSTMHCIFVQWIFFFLPNPATKSVKSFNAVQFFQCLKNQKQYHYKPIYIHLCRQKKIHFIFKTDFRIDWCVWRTSFMIYWTTLSKKLFFFSISMKVVFIFFHFTLKKEW